MSRLTAQRIIHFTLFFLFLIGTYGLSAYVFSLAVDGGIINPLFYAATALTWGIILLALYLIFERQEWDWWT